MAIDRSYIRTKAMVILLDEAGLAHAVSRLEPTVENPGGYHRLIGGSIDLGERAADAAEREVQEELGSGLVDVQPAGVVENIFEYNGELGHEVVFVFSGRLASPVPVPGDYVDGDSPMYVEWRPVDDAGVDLPLYPVGVADLVREAAAARRAGPA